MKTKVFTLVFLLFISLSVLQAQDKTPTRYDMTMELSIAGKTIKQKISSANYGINKNKIADEANAATDAGAEYYNDIYFSVGGMDFSNDLIKILADNKNPLNVKIIVIDKKKGKETRVFEMKNVTFNFSDSYYNSNYSDEEDAYSTSGSITSDNLTINGIKVK